MDKLAVILFAALAVIAGAVFIGFLLSYPLMLLWNVCLVGAVNGIKEVTWLQMWGLSILCNCLFKTSISKS